VPPGRYFRMLFVGQYEGRSGKLGQKAQACGKAR
jgi:hypothetical protein